MSDAKANVSRAPVTIVRTIALLNMAAISMAAASAAASASQDGAPAPPQRLLTNVLTDENAFFEEMRPQSSQMTGEQWQQTWRAWAERQRPLIDSADLEALILTKRESIATIEMRSHVEFTQGADPNVWSWAREVEFAAKDDSLLKRTTYLSGRRTAVTSEAFAFGGGVVRTVTTDRSGRSNGEITSFQGRIQFIDVGDMLPQCMLVDSVRDLDREWYPFDLERLLRFGSTYVLENTVEVDGAECLAVVLGAPARFRVFLDLERDLSVVRFDEFEYTYVENALPARHLVYARSLSDLQDLGNGLWLPRMVITERYAGDRNPNLPPDTLMWRRTHELLEARINEELASSLFTDVFAEGTMVFDRITNIAYRQGANPSIEDAIAAGLTQTIAESESYAQPAVGGHVDSSGEPFGSRLDIAVALGVLLAIGGGWLFRRMRHAG